ncbi:MAG: GNAT family N-acetyltransferase [Candidatus Levybacteria bacterium]|nr:GNAT family N-acetyltransferase [Candidatus Levybacteria bacterium]
MKIRGYKNSDYSSVKLILKQSDLYDEIWDSEENLKGMIDKNPESILVTEDNTKLIAVIYLISFGSKVSFIFRLAVKKEYRNKGIATKLVEFAKDVLSKKGVSEVGLFADANNKQLYRFYNKRSFQTSNKHWIYLWKKLSQ